MQISRNLQKTLQKTFESKKKKYPPFIFAGRTVNKNNDVYFLAQATDYTEGIKN